MSKDPITNGAGLAAYGLATVMLSTLKAKGILSDEDVRAIFTSLLSDTQKSGLLATADGQAAYGLLASLAATADPTSTPKN
jgi:hypothetical protein